jgi:endo-1,4-beta-xylanase
MSDGATYTIWENQRVNEPSIEGTSTFNQYISVRQSPRTSGTVTLENHFQAWANLGLNLGSFSYQVIAVEGWGGTGAATQTVSK